MFESCILNRVLSSTMAFGEECSVFWQVCFFDQKGSKTLFYIGICIFFVLDGGWIHVNFMIVIFTP